MSLSGQFFKMKIKRPDGDDTWYDLDISVEASPSISQNNSDVTQHGDEGVRRLELQIDETIDLTLNASQTDPDAVKELQDAAVSSGPQNDSIEVEYSTDGRAATGPTDLWDLVTIVESFDKSAPADGEQQYDFSLALSDGNKPNVTRGGSFST